MNISCYLKMDNLMLILCVIPCIVTAITISPNGNSPDIKMVGGMMIDIQKGFTPMASNQKEITIDNYEKSRMLANNTAKLSINERYRRLIPYMTFYYANDLVTPTTDNSKNVEVEKAEIIEATTIGNLNDRHPKKIIYSSHRNIPRYQGNRLTQYNIASANPTKFLNKETSGYSNAAKTNYSPLLSEHTIIGNPDYDYVRIPVKAVTKSPSVPFSAPARKPYVNFHNHEDSANIRYYLSEKEHVPKYKLIPYEQTPPVPVVTHNEQFYEAKRPVPVLINKDHVYIKSRPLRPHVYYENVNIQQNSARKNPATVSENYYEKQRPRPLSFHPIVESGFRPIAMTTAAPTRTSILYEMSSPYHENVNHVTPQPYDSSTTTPIVNSFRPNYYQYVVEPKYRPVLEPVTYTPVVEQPTYKPIQHTPANAITLGDLINSLQLNKSIPNPITRENVGSSIRTLLKVLNALKVAPQQNEVESSILSSSKPVVSSEILVEVPEKPDIDVTEAPEPVEEDLHDEPYLATVKPPSQHLDDFPTSGGTSQRFPLPITSDDEGGTPGRPGIDYPTLTTIPQTSFNCKTQRYKGFFADTETRCQVWHYCDLNGGQASFLCPNGTIFSQAGLTCDWWFNVRCSSTAQLYVLNESLYKYILPHSPKFPEDYSGPLVDKYLSLKFKEMEEQFRKNKNKQTASEKMDSGDSQESSETPEEKEAGSTVTPEHSEDKISIVSEASVNVESPGTSGNVERLTE